MRVLWFTNTPSNFVHGTNPYNGGGWISSLENLLKNTSGIELGICFYINKLDDYTPIVKDGVTYFPLKAPYSQKIRGKVMKVLLSDSKFLFNQKQHLLNVVDKFHPDLINVFGTEQLFGLVTEEIQVPVVIHIQGLLNPCKNSYFPPNCSMLDYLFPFFSISSYLRIRWRYRQLCKSALRERKIIRVNKYFMGRTEWDRNVIKVFNQNANYFYCSEVLREEFYCLDERILPNRLVITSTISSPPYKGIDMVLKCAKILKFELGLDFEWNVFGNVDIWKYERKLNISFNSVNVNLKGVADAHTLKDNILSSTVFVHPSYIDNSPNSVCEAQLLGCPVVGQYVGGLTSLIQNGKTGFLVPANDPYQMALIILELFVDKKLNKNIGDMGRNVARARHDKEAILNDLLNIYSTIIKNSHE